jgi:hypothetical protein
MNRRDFIKSLLAVGWGSSITIPITAIATAPESAIEVAWSAAQAEPTILFVDEWGAISNRPGYDGVDFNTTRQELLQIGDPPETGAGLVNFINRIGLEDKLDRHFSDVDSDYYRDHDDEFPYQTWQEWVEADGYIEARALVDQWLDGLPDDNDYLYADGGGTSSRGDSVQFFLDRKEEAKLLSIFVPNMCGSWSPDFAAVLNIDVDEANAIAIANGLPIQFEQWGD